MLHESGLTLPEMGGRLSMFLTRIVSPDTGKETTHPDWSVTDVQNAITHSHVDASYSTSTKRSRFGTAFPSPVAAAPELISCVSALHAQTCEPPTLGRTPVRRKLLGVDFV